MRVSFDGIDNLYVTFYANGDIEAGAPVKMSGNCQVSACANGEAFIGFAYDDAENGYVTVQTRGYFTAAYSGTAPTLGWAGLVSDGDGVKLDATKGARVRIMEIDTDEETVGFFM